MGNCMTETKVDQEVQMYEGAPESPLGGEPRLVQYSVPSTVVRDLGSTTPASSIGFRPDSALFDQSIAITQSIDHLAKQLDTSRMWQEGKTQTAKFQHVLSETRVLEAKLDSIRQKHSDFGPSLIRLASETSNQYLDLEHQLEEEMERIRKDMEGVQEEVETLNEQAKDLLTEEK